MSEERSSFGFSRSGGYGRERGLGRNRGYQRKKICRFCSKAHVLNYRDPDTLKRYITERGKILPRRVTGACSRHQHWLALAVKRARILALLPFLAR